MTELTPIFQTLFPISCVILVDRFFDIWSWLKRCWRRMVVVLAALSLSACATGNPQHDLVGNILIGAALGAAASQPVKQPPPRHHHHHHHHHHKHDHRGGHR